MHVVDFIYFYLLYWSPSSSSIFPLWICRFQYSQSSIFPVWSFSSFITEYLCFHLRGGVIALLSLFVFIPAYFLVIFLSAFSPHVCTIWTAYFHFMLKKMFFVIDNLSPPYSTILRQFPAVLSFLLFYILILFLTFSSIFELSVINEVFKCVTIFNVFVFFKNILLIFFYFDKNTVVLNLYSSNSLQDFFIDVLYIDVFVFVTLKIGIL